MHFTHWFVAAVASWRANSLQVSARCFADEEASYGRNSLHLKGVWPYSCDADAPPSSRGRFAWDGGQRAGPRQSRTKLGSVVYYERLDKGHLRQAYETMTLSKVVPPRLSAYRGFTQLLDKTLALLLNALATAGVFACVALGFGLVYRTTKIFHFAHGGVYVAAGYVLYALVAKAGVPTIAAVAVSACAGGLLGVAVDRAIYRPLEERGRTRPALMIASLGTFIVFENVAALIFGSDTRVLLPGRRPSVCLAGVSVTDLQGVKIGLLVLVTAVALCLRTRSMGLRLRGVSDDPVMAVSLGIDTERARTLAFLTGSALTAIAAGVSSLDTGIEPHAGLSALLVSFVAVFIGGPDIFLGPIVGAIVLSLTRSGFTFALSDRWSQLSTFALLIAFMAVRPEGILGKHRRPEEMHG